MNDVKNIRNLFDSFYKGLYHDWRVNHANKKAPKDIVGKHYEKHRKEFWRYFGIKAKPETIGDVDADLVIRDPKTKSILAIEECKGHYVDKCFLKRFIFNATDIIAHFHEKGEQVPLLILSCPTQYRLFKDKFPTYRGRFKKEFADELQKKVIYLPYCNHDRVGRTKYYKSSNNCFNLSDSLISEHISIANKILKGV